MLRSFSKAKASMASKFQVPFSFENPNYGAEDDTFNAFVEELDKHGRDSLKHQSEWSSCEDKHEENDSFEESIPYTHSIPFSFENPNYGAEDTAFNAFIADLLNQDAQSKPTLALEYTDKVRRNYTILLYFLIKRLYS